MKFKIVQLFGVLALLVGVVMIVGAKDASGAWWIIAGSLAYAVGRIAAWLTNEGQT